MSVSALENRLGSSVVSDASASPPLRAPKANIPQPVQKKETRNLGAAIVGMATIAAITFGFMIKPLEIMVPGEGLGYKLGLAGGCMMLLLLFYPAFKRTRFFGSGTKAAFWFRWHMLLGVAGPVLVFFHSNFSMGALNSNVALFSMILVAGSGVIGRYIYTHIHTGLSGARLDVGGLLKQATQLMAGIEADVGGSGGTISKALADFSVKATPRNPGFGASLLNLVSMPIQLRVSRAKVMREVRRSIENNTKSQNWTRLEAKANTRAAKNHVNEFLLAVSRAAQFAFWERMFSLWHVIHVPLFFLLLVSGVIHVIAVHMY
jgi:hypothetical protein